MRNKQNNNKDYFLILDTLRFMTQHVKTKSDFVPLSSLNRTKSFKCNLKDNNAKSIEDRYEDIFKSYSHNYFQNTQIGDLIKPANRKEQIRCRKNSLQQQGATWSLNREKQQKYRTQQQFNQNKQINRLFKIGDIFNSDTENKFYDKSKDKYNSFNNTLKNTHSYMKKQQPSFAEKPNNKMKSSIGPKFWSRATTGKKGRYMSAKNKKLKQCDFKFIKIDRRETSEEVKQLKNSIYQLQELAANKYGIEFKKMEKTNQNVNNFQQNIYPEIQQMEHKLKQIRNQRQQSGSHLKNTEDYSIPTNFMKSLMCNYKTQHNFFNHAKKTPFTKYLRV